MHRFSKKFLFLGSFCCLLLLIACEPSAPDLAGVADGKALFEELCASCHKADGRGNFFLGYPALKSSPWEEWQIVHRLSLIPNASEMPDFRALSEQQKRLVAAYVGELQVRAEPQAAAGKAGK